MLKKDGESLPDLLAAVQDEAVRFLQALDEQDVAHEVPSICPFGLPETGIGAAAALSNFCNRYGPWMSGSAGPRYFGFVTGGVTPAALVGDWLTSTYDQNLLNAGESGALQLTLDALGMFRDLLGLPDAFGGAFVTGATASSIVALATAREWVGRARGVDVSTDGGYALGPVAVLSGTAHSSISKALSVIGLGRSSLRAIPTYSNREAVDVDELVAALKIVALEGLEPAVVVANAGTVNTCDFDDILAIAALREQYQFWLHVDGAFGAIAAASPRYRHLLAGLDAADSVTVDAHKWLNVPYESAVVLTRHLELQGGAFQSAGAYLPTEVRPDTFLHLTPENSQRLRALPVWMTLIAYGREGYAEIVERCCDIANWFGEQIEASSMFRLLAPIRLNGVCFTLMTEPTVSTVAGVLSSIQKSGVAFLTPTIYSDVPGVRLSVTNWRTSQKDAERTWAAMKKAVEEYESE